MAFFYWGTVPCPNFYPEQLKVSLIKFFSLLGIRQTLVQCLWWATACFRYLGDGAIIWSLRCIFILKYLVLILSKEILQKFLKEIVLFQWSGRGYQQGVNFFSTKACDQFSVRSRLCGETSQSHPWLPVYILKIFYLKFQYHSPVRRILLRR